MNGANLNRENWYITYSYNDDDGYHSGEVSFKAVSREDAIMQYNEWLEGLGISLNDRTIESVSR